VSSVDKGTRWAKLVEDFLAGLGFTVTRSRWFDSGDDMTAALPGMVLSVEAKNHRQITLASFVDQAETQARATEIPVVFIHRRGHVNVADGYVVMSGHAFGRLVS
jgi:hypothetical protein